jgi:hypothetical protein
MTAPVQTALTTQLDTAIDALQALRATVRELHAEITGIRRDHKELVLERLRQVVEEVGQNRPARQVTCPEVFVREWNDFVAGKAPPPGPRAIRYLCWKPDISTSDRFREHLQIVRFDLRARSIQGLLRSCHMSWGPDVRRRGGAVDFAAGKVRAYAGPNRVLKRWRENEQLVVDDEAFARDLADSDRNPHDQCALWGVDEQSKFLTAALDRAADKIRATKPVIPMPRLRAVIFWDGWALRDFKDHVSRTLLLRDLERRAKVDELKSWIVSDARLQDPRLPANHKNWVGIAKDAHDLVIRWLAADDIEFFFEHVLPRGQDPHGRKPFWLKYLSQVRRSRPLLSTNDFYRLKRVEGKIRSGPASFGRINDAMTSAFLLDFGQVLVVEFSQPGNACYCFAKQLAEKMVPDFWPDKPFDRSGFRRTDLVRPLRWSNVGSPHLASGFRFSHVSGWQENVSRQLAHMGIRGQ